ncbi:uncharacterized protein GLRG_01617, partial [Colletotrichum graminicola M1.001]
TIEDDKACVCCPLRVIFPQLSARHNVTRTTQLESQPECRSECPLPPCLDSVHYNSPISLVCGPLCVAELAIIASVGRPEVLRSADLDLTMPWATCPCYL